MCQASDNLRQAEQSLVVSQLTRRLEGFQLEMEDWGYLFTHLGSPAAGSLKAAVQQIEAVLNELRFAGKTLLADPENISHVTFLSR